MRYFHRRRQLALQADVIMFEGSTFPDRLTSLLGVYVEAKALESRIDFSFADERGNTLAFLELIRERLKQHQALTEAAYVASIIQDSSTHSLHYEEVIRARITLTLMEWPDDTQLQDAWARCPINSPRLSEVLETMWPDLVSMEAILSSKS